MTETSPFVVGRGTAFAVVLFALVLGAGSTWVVMRNSPAPRTETMAAGGTATPTATPATASPTSAASGSLPDIVVPLSKDGVARAGIQVATATAKGVTEDLRLPGTVEPNAYRQVLVTPLVGGRVVRVSAGLGDRVRRGQTIAQVYSPELADARAKYVAARAMLDAHDRELQRTQKLMEIGASSRQELERIHAEHAAQIAEVESAGSRLRLLGASPETVAQDDDANATIDVASPIDGVVTERLANVGLNVDPAAKLFTIVDLSSVWVVANVYEQDLHRIRDGVRAIVVAKAYPDRSFEGRVSYIDPQLSQETRTAKLRVDVANPQGVLRLGMFTDVSISAAGGTSIQIPKGAVQSIGEHQVVYLPAPDDPTRFTEREVRVGRSMGDSVEVVSGVNAGESVVSQGSFFIRAEAERLGLRSAVRSPSTSKPSAGGVAVPPAQTAKIVVSETGFEPAKVSLRAGRPARITFVRTTDQTCGTEVVFPSLDVKRVLPLNQPVTIEFTPQAGEIAFACGMNMLKGTVVVE